MWDLFSWVPFTDRKGRLAGCGRDIIEWAVVIGTGVGCGSSAIVFGPRLHIKAACSSYQPSSYFLRKLEPGEL